MQHTVTTLRTLRLVALLALLVTSLASWSQSRDITTAINSSENVSVEAPSGLNQRNNNELNRPAGEKKSTTTAKKAEGEKIDEIDDNGETNKENTQPKEKQRTESSKPKRSNSTSQTIKSRSNGFRIQAYTDNSGRNAKSAVKQRARAIAMRFPQYRSYISYNAPSWRLRIGDFKTQAEAQAALSRIRSVFPSYARQMTIVRDHINVWN